MNWPGPPTHRQHKVLCYWLRWEWSRPSRADHYVMQVALQVCYEVRSLFSKKRITLKLKQFVIKFIWGDKEEAKLSKEQVAMMAKRRYLMGFGMVKDLKEAESKYRIGGQEVDNGSGTGN